MKESFEPSANSDDLVELIIVSIDNQGRIFIRNDWQKVLPSKFFGSQIHFNQSNANKKGSQILALKNVSTKDSQQDWT